MNCEMGFTLTLALSLKGEGILMLLGWLDWNKKP